VGAGRIGGWLLARYKAEELRGERRRSWGAGKAMMIARNPTSLASSWLRSVLALLFDDAERAPDMGIGQVRRMPRDQLDPNPPARRAVAVEM